VVATVIAAVTYQGHPLFWFNLLGNLAFTVIMWFFLYRPHATAFFKGELLLEEQGTGERESDASATIPVSRPWWRSMRMMWRVEVGGI
jgi:hypothetical protein